MIKHRLFIKNNDINVLCVILFAGINHAHIYIAFLQIEHFRFNIFKSATVLEKIV